METQIQTNLQVLKNYGVAKVIFVDMDAVMTGLFIQSMKQAYGEVDFVHSLRKKHTHDTVISDARIIHLSDNSVLCTCWDYERTMAAMINANFDKNSFRIYSLGKRLF